MPQHTVYAILAFGLLSLGACAHTYAPGPGMSVAQLGPDAADCRLRARASRPDMSFEARGTQKAVAIETGVMLGLGVASTLVHDSQTFDDCMEARGYQIADGTTGPATAQPAAVTGAQVPIVATPLAAPSPPPYDERIEQMVRAQAAAEAWLIAERTLNDPHASRNQRDLYTFLCEAGDRSACLMRIALNR